MAQSNNHLGTVCKILMNCVSCVVMFFYLLELTLKTQVSNTMNIVGISSNALFANSATSLNLSLDAELLATFDLLC